MNTPDTEGVPVIVIVLFVQLAVTPVGNPVAVPMPVAPVVVKVMVVVSGALIQTEGLAEAGVTVLINTVIVPVALNVPQPPTSGMV